MKQTIRPEFLNRIDEIVMFTPLTRDDVRQIVVLQIRQINEMLAQNSIALQVTDKAIDWLAAEGYDPMFGARPVKRTLQRYLVNELSKKRSRPATGRPQQHDHRRRRRQRIGFQKLIIRRCRATARPAQGLSIG